MLSLKVFKCLWGSFRDWGFGENIRFKIAYENEHGAVCEGGSSRLLWWVEPICVLNSYTNIRPINWTYSYSILRLKKIGKKFGMVLYLKGVTFESRQISYTQMLSYKKNIFRWKWRKKMRFGRRLKAYLIYTLIFPEWRSKFSPRTANTGRLFYSLVYNHQRTSKTLAKANCSWYSTVSLRSRIGQFHKTGLVLVIYVAFLLLAPLLRGSRTFKKNKVHYNKISIRSQYTSSNYYPEKYEINSTSI